jgi:hypothetical protein
VPSLNVLIHDSRFSVQIEGTGVRLYATASDCMWAASCEAYLQNKHGKTEADLTGTDFKFPSSIPYDTNSWPTCASGWLAPNMSADRKKWSVRCGGYCGGCQPTSLVLELDGC